MGYREIELRDKCKICDGYGRILNMGKVRMLNLRPKDITINETYECSECKGVGYHEFRALKAEELHEKCQDK